MVNVICGIIFKDDKIFLARRKKGKSLENKWEFPGGKIEDNESEVQALKRELIEELGMTIMVMDKLGSNIHNYKSHTIKLTAYKCEFISATFKLTDHDKYSWVEPNKLLKFDLAPADIPLVEFIPLAH